MDLIESLNRTVAELNREMSKPHVEDIDGLTVPVSLLFDALGLLIWAGDEIVQLREDVHGAMGAVQSLTAEVESLEAELTDAFSTIAENLVATL